MSFLDFIFGGGPSISMEQGVELAKAPGAVLLDVRTEEEYAQGHLPGSVNCPLHELDGVKKLVKDKQSPLYVYCLSGARSGQSCRKLQQMGYENVNNIGGISGWRGPLE